MNKPRTPLNDPSLELIDLQHQDSPEFNEALQREFGGALDDTGEGFSRRRWLQLMGASLALGGMAGCRYKENKIATFAFRPHNRVPGIPQHYAGRA